MRLKPPDNNSTGPKIYRTYEDAVSAVYLAKFGELSYRIVKVEKGYLPVFRCPTWEIVRIVRAKGFIALIRKTPKPKGVTKVSVKD